MVMHLVCHLWDIDSGVSELAEERKFQPRFANIPTNTVMMDPKLLFGEFCS